MLVYARCDHDYFRFVAAVTKPGWMDVPARHFNCAPGLEYLDAVTHVFVKQKVDALEASCCWSSNNVYQVLNNNGFKVCGAWYVCLCVTV